MLRTQLRLPAARLPLSRTFLRSSVRLQHAQPASSPSFYDAVPPSSERPAGPITGMLYSVPPLPAMPPPLPTDVSPAEAAANLRPGEALAPMNSSALGAQEQLAVLNACLASGDIARAEDVARRIRAKWLKEGQGTSLAELLPPRVHADFLKAHLVRAIQPYASTNPRAAAFERSLTQPDSSNAGLGSRSVVQMNRYVAKAWAYFDSLLGSQWETYNPDKPSRRGVNGAVDPSVLAVMMKGVVALGPDVYNPSTLTDPNRNHRPITFFLPIMRQLNIDLRSVMLEPIFDIHLPSYLGQVSREQVLEALKETGRGREGWAEYERVIEEVKEDVQRLKDGREKEKKMREKLPEIDAVQNDDKVNMSLKTLRTNLITLSLGDAGAEMPRATRQRLLEESSYDAARQLYIHEMEALARVGKDKEMGMQANWLQTIMFDWLGHLERHLLEASIESGRDSAWGKDADVEPFLRLLPPSKMALITIVEVMRLYGSGGVSEGVKAARAMLHVGRAIENEYHAETLKEIHTNKGLQAEIERLSETGSIGEDGSVQGRTAEQSLNILWRRELAKREKEGDASWRPAWTQPIRAKVGSILVDALIQVAKVERSARHPRTDELVTEVQPAFSHAYQYLRGRKLGVIQVNPVVADRLDRDPLNVTLHPRYLPMLVKPKPWLSWNSGSYLIHQTQMMRTKDSEEQVQYLRQASDNNTLDTIFAGLDTLGAVSWKINRKVFDVVSTVWNSGEAIADIPPKDSLDKAPEVEVPPDVNTSPRARDTYRRRIRKALQERRSAHSTRCDLNYKLEIARAFADEKFYFPHNLDFRGRAYPIPPNLSHIGDDMCRGLLLFGESKPLGERGLRWLKIHLANLTGFDKASFDEREAFTMEHLDEVFDSADKPLEGNRWWAKADDPWQCLSTCIELTNALRSPEPTAFLSSLPVHQDGTCNGLQHYAALGGDLKGAHQVNLDAGDRPSDIYSGVANAVNEFIERDAEKGLQEAQLLLGKVTRKVVKQTVMTTVYGVTFIGAKNQIQRQLKDRGDIPAEHLYTCALYLGRLVLDSIGDIFKGATAIQTWLNRCARLIAKSIPPARIEAAMQQQQNKPHPRSKKVIAEGLSRIPKEQMTSVIWTTPLGLPVVQPYRKAKKRQVTTALQTVFIADPSLPSEVDPRAQATAFPPNFIHSLDATHMMMTALACRGKIAFASVHDSYWTHACDVDEMSVILREAFIELHSQDILGRLRQEFVDRYAGHVIPVSKVPAGLRSAMPGDAHRPLNVNPVEPSLAAHAGQAPADPVASADVLSELEAEDGPAGLSLFDQARKVTRVATKGKKSVKSPFDSDVSKKDFDDLEDVAMGAHLDENGEIAEEDGTQGKDDILGKTSTRTDAKLIYLADVLPPAPGKGNFDLNRVRESSYFL
ncbi:hypothetical protein JCM8097_009044 [Rhodosporidiobolus ruineniae]